MKVKTKPCTNPFCATLAVETIVRDLWKCMDHNFQSYEPCKPYPASRDEKRKR